MTSTQATPSAPVLHPKYIPTPSAPDLLFADDTSSKRLYWDRSQYDSMEAQKLVLAKSATLYVGNLAFTTRTAQIRSHFSLVGKVKQIHMGLDRHKKTPCGFCFVQYHDRSSALAAVANLSGSKLDGRVIRVELDAGFAPGRQYGRGKSGGQVRDDKTATGRVRQASAMAVVGDKRERDNTSSNEAGGGQQQEGGDGNETNNFDDMEDGQPSAKRQRIKTEDEDDKKNW